MHLLLETIKAPLTIQEHMCSSLSIKYGPSDTSREASGVTAPAGQYKAAINGMASPFGTKPQTAGVT